METSLPLTLTLTRALTLTLITLTLALTLALARTSCASSPVLAASSERPLTSRLLAPRAAAAAAAEWRMGHGPQAHWAGRPFIVC